jgi:hypothetical protein
MTRPAPRELAALSIGTLAVAGVLLLLGVYAPRWWSGAGGTYAPRAIVASARVDPAYSLFGDLLVLRAHIVVDDRAIDPGSVALESRFSPLRVVSEARHLRRLGGRAATIDYVVRVQCVSLECLGASGRAEESGAIRSTPIRLRTARVVAERRTDGFRTSVPLKWPQILVHSRLTPIEVKTGEPGLGSFPAQTLSYAVSPDRLGGLLVGAGALLALAAGFLLAGAVRGTPVSLRLRIPAHLTPLERALALVRVAAHDETPTEARKALERLAAELRRSGHRELAQNAGRMAWSAQDPSPTALEGLVDDVAGSVNGH